LNSDVVILKVIMSYVVSLVSTPVDVETNQSSNQKNKTKKKNKKKGERGASERRGDTYLGLGAQPAVPRDSDRYWSLLSMAARGHRDTSTPLTFHSHKLWEGLEGETINEFEPLL